MADTAAPVKIGDFSAKKPELPKNVGHLLQDPVEIDCPACRKHNVTRVDKIPVTIWQKLISLINSCCACCKDFIKWEGRFDYNHYCSECGCYIGRYITPGCSQRQMLRGQRMKAEIGRYSDENDSKVVKDSEGKDKDKSINES